MTNRGDVPSRRVHEAAPDPPPGMVLITRMIRSGFVIDIIGAIIIAVGVTVMAALVGLH